MKLQQMNNNPTYQQSMCASCATSLESNTTTTRKRDVNETKTIADDTARRVPQLRFPEYQNAGEWELVTLKDIGKTYNGLSGKNGEDFGEGESYVTYKQVFSGETIKIEECSLVSLKDGEKQHKLKKGDILVTISSETAQEIGMVNVITENLKTNVYLNSFCFIFRPYNNCLIPSFAKYLFSSSSYRKQIVSIAQGITRYNISKDNFLNLKLYIPNLLEQQKIASCLLAIDDEILTNTQKLEQLKTHKKALLQKIFPQRGKTTPELRFPEFTGDWISKRMEDIIIVNSGRDYKHLKSGNVPVYGTGGYMLSVDDYLSDVDAVGIGRKGTIDKPQYLKAPFWTVDTLFFLTTKEGYDVRFMYYLSQTIAWRKYGEQTGVPSLSKVSIESLEIVVPKNITEQKRIADVLSSIDDNIDSCSKQINELLHHKKGLMQKLFPRNI